MIKDLKESVVCGLGLFCYIFTISFVITLQIGLLFLLALYLDGNL